MADLYETQTRIEKLNLEDSTLRKLILLVIDNICLNADAGVKLSGFRLLRSLCHEHSQEFLALVDKVFLCIKVFEYIQLLAYGLT